jgi:hypothetical protein
MIFALTACDRPPSAFRHPVLLLIDAGNRQTGHQYCFDHEWVAYGRFYVLVRYEIGQSLITINTLMVLGVLSWG